MGRPEVERPCGDRGAAEEDESLRRCDGSSSEMVCAKRITVSVNTSEAGDYPLFSPLYSGKGLIVGWVKFAAAEPVGDEIVWIKPATGKRPYANGFSLMTSLSGAVYAKPAQNAQTLVLNPTGQAPIANRPCRKAVKPIALAIVLQSQKWIHDDVSLDALSTFCCARTGPMALLSLQVAGNSS